MANIRAVKITFYLAAAWNLMAGITTLAFYDPMFNSAGYSVPYSPLWTLSFAVMVLIFALGYFMVAQDPIANKGIALMGAIGKAAIFAIFFVFLLRDAISVVTFLAGFIDFAFAILFGLFYVHADDLAASMQAES